MANAKEVTQDFDKAKQEPLAASKDKVSKPGITFAAQDSLPKLPIPDLESTVKKYLKALDPLQTAREHADSERAVTEFLRTDGPALQEKLKGYAEGQSSYIEQFCKCFRFGHLIFLLTTTRVRLLPQLRQPGRSQPQSILPSGR